MTLPQQNLQQRLGLTDEAIKYLVLTAIDSGIVGEDYVEEQYATEMLDDIFDAHATITAEMEEAYNGNNFV
jgi:ATP phosphoribosyltransferase